MRLFPAGRSGRGGSPPGSGVLQESPAIGDVQGALVLAEEPLAFELGHEAADMLGGEAQEFAQFLAGEGKGNGMVPGSDPFAALAAALLAEPTLGPQLRQGVFKTEALLTKQLKSEPMLATAPLHEALQRVARGKPARLALGIDQAERLFTETATAAAVSFAALVTALVNDGLCFVVMVLRSDAYAQFQTIEPFLALREAGASFDLVAPNQAELEEIVKRPLAACDPPLSFETIEGKSLASRLVTDTKGGDALPLLQMTLSRLYEAADERGDNVLRFADYRGMDAAVTDTANDVLATLHDASRAELPSLVTTLVRDIVTDPWTGAQVAVAGNFVRQNFIANKPSRAALVDAFIDRRLLTAEGETIRPTHEALLRIWPSAKAIIDETASLLRLRGALESRVVEWKAAIGAEKARHLDIPPSLLAGAQRLATLLPADLSADMLDFIQQASLAARNKHNAKLRLAWGTAIGGFASAAVGIVLCLWAEFESNKAQTSLQLATATLRSFAQIIGSVNNRDADSTTQTNNIDANIDNIAALYQSSPADAAALYLAAAQMRQLSPDSGTAYANKALAMLQSLHLANPHDPDITLDYDRGLIDRARAEAGSGIRNDAAIADFSAGIASLQAVLATNRIPETRRMIMLLLGHAEEDLGDLTVRIAQAETDSNKKTVDIAQAGAGYTQAATVFQIFSAENKGDPQGTAEQAWALNKSGDIANQQLQIATAASRYGQAADLLRGLGKQLAANPIWPQHLAIIDMNLGIIRLSQMDFYGAQTIFSSAYTEFSGLRDLASSQNVELQADVAWSQDFIGFANYLCAEQGSTTCLADAETVLRGAQEARTTLHQLAPGQLQLVDDLAHTNATLAAVQGLRDIAAHDETGAAKDFEQAASLTASILREGNWEVWRLADFEDRQGEAAAALGDAQTATADFTKAAQTLASQLCAADTANCMAPTPIILTLNTRISNDLSHINGPRPLQ